ncbi:hypothetical protein [Curtobacterium flaccumfaciens]|uniref:hypothetical protein n=1 Tax=Curtobacterium flaccumfaciens TaxID=2035 RepID=UPI00136759BC|nr:hypothetical protein [Curtobacterium flaccumfaciens]MBT1664940.1 hypothetical protein [Curtobacterium flaccumfaciens pv. flaccumfaciens]QFS79406.2 hypothetical protein GBG65_07930 [Curtobacterium flaccumfaciens pv. flaccumfaciens]
MTERPAPHTVGQLEALRVLLQAAKEAEVAAVGPDRRGAFRTTRSLIGAARKLGFTLTVLAEMLEVTEGSVRNRTGPPLPMLPSVFLALIPSGAVSPWTAGIRDLDHGSQREVDAVELLRWYLRNTGGDNRAA